MLNKNQFDRDFFQRLLFLILFFVIAWIVRFLILITSVMQVLSSLFMQAPNRNLTLFGSTIALYFYDVMQYLSFATNQPPFPFSPLRHQ